MTTTAKRFGEELLESLRSIDLNHNGVPDYEDPDAWLFVAHLLAAGIIRFGPQHETLARELAEKFEGAGGKSTP